MRAQFSDGMSGGVGAQWELERLLVDPTLGFIVLTAGGSTLAFLAVAWLFQGVLGVTWPLLLVGAFLVVTLLQGPPVELYAEASPVRRASFQAAVWASRTVLFVALLIVSSLALDGQPIKWGFAAAGVLVFVPVLWLPLHQLRQFGLLSLIGVLPMAYLWGVGVITLTQAGLISMAFLSWFSEAASAPLSFLATIAGLGWLVGGNILLTVLSARGLDAGESNIA